MGTGESSVSGQRRTGPLTEPGFSQEKGDETTTSQIFAFVTGRATEADSLPGNFSGLQYIILMDIRGCGCLVLMAIAMCFTLLVCAVLVVFIILQHTSITAERESQSKNYKETVQVFNQMNSILQGTNSHLMAENNQLQERFSNLSDELYKAVQVFNQTNSILQGTNSHLMTENTQLQEIFNDLSDELKKAYQKGWFSGRFFLSNVSKSWSESRQYCKDQGGDLVIIKTEIKQNYLTSYISGNEKVWIGLFDIVQEGKMEWVDNSPLKQG
ncbi:C-type lectin domain family 4 member M [Labeo rohita]|uniref:C-type lectin domain family 4 member M n=1 Tax=Labeo rohita TaxID=84645 RepID=A0ABQ8MVS9_LABRO|nr:C-type lectin domain family 4 member M [Labeo rohita]